MERIGLEPGTEIGGYRIVNQLGSGAMGVVYRALDGGGHPVAFKMLRSNVIDADELRERLIREATAMRRIHHPAVAAMLDVETEADETFIVTQLVEGPTLESYVADHGPLPAAELHAFATRLYEALEAVHSAQVVHRDMKPNNVLMSPEGPVLIDFGIAHGMADPRLTATGLVVGTPGYLAPELINGQNPSAATDLWGWAAVVVFAATGRPPYGLGSFETVFSRAMAGRPDVDGLDERVAVALRGALAVKPEYRWHPVEVLEELKDAAENPNAAGTFYEPHADERDVTQIVDYQGTELEPDDATHLAALPRQSVAGTVPLDQPGSTRVLPAQQVPADPTQVLAPVFTPPSYQPAGYASDEYQPESAYAQDFISDDSYVRPIPPSRSVLTTLGLLAAAAGGALYPALTAITVVAILLIFRTVGMAWDAFHERREYRGQSKRDGLVAAASLPWNVVRALVSFIPSLLVAAATYVIVGGVLLWLVQSVLTLTGPHSETWAIHGAVALAMMAGVLLLWRGPITRHSREGGRVTIQALFPGTVATVIVALILLAVIVVVVVMCVSGVETHWAPLQDPPSFRQ